MKLKVLSIILSILLLFSGCATATEFSSAENETVAPSSTSSVSGDGEEKEGIISEAFESESSAAGSQSLESSSKEAPTKENGLPDFDGSTPYITVNNNKPYFTKKELGTKSFERYAPLDGLGRCGEALACIGRDIMPTEERGAIGQVKPTGWHLVKYDIVDGKYLYNRCHLIGFQLTGENANERNLITGTRYLNIEGMLSFENLIADYVKSTGNHVMYRVTPVFEGNNLLASGVYMEGYSVEDNGRGVCFNVYAFNAQPGVSINYKNGNSKLIAAKNESSASSNSSSHPVSDSSRYILNTNTMKFHYPTCRSVKQMNDENKMSVKLSRDKLIKQGYGPCGICNP